MDVNLLTLNSLLTANLAHPQARVGSAAATGEMSVPRDSSADVVGHAEGGSASERLTVRKGETLTTDNIIAFSQILAQSVLEPPVADSVAGASIPNEPQVGPDVAEEGLNSGLPAVMLMPIQLPGVSDAVTGLITQPGQAASSPAGTPAGETKGYAVQDGVRAAEDTARLIITQTEGTRALADVLPRQLQLANNAQPGAETGQSNVRAIQTEQIQAGDSQASVASGEQTSARASVVTSANQPAPQPLNNGQYVRLDETSADTISHSPYKPGLAIPGNGDVPAHTLQPNGNTDLLPARAALFEGSEEHIGSPRARSASEVPGKANAQKQNTPVQTNQQSSPDGAAGFVQVGASAQKELSSQMPPGGEGQKNNNSAPTDNPAQSANNGMALGQDIQTIVRQYTPVAARTGRGGEQGMPDDLGATLREQIQQSVRDSLQGGIHQITIRLNPPELGRVTIRFRQDGGDITAALEAGRVETRAEIQNAIPEIIRNLQQAGIQIKQFDVSLADTSSAGQGSSREQLGQDAWLGGQNATYSDGDRGDYNQWADVHSQATATSPYEPPDVRATAVDTLVEPATLNVLM